MRGFSARPCRYCPDGVMFDTGYAYAWRKYSARIGVVHEMSCNLCGRRGTTRSRDPFVEDLDSLLLDTITTLSVTWSVDHRYPGKEFE